MDGEDGQKMMGQHHSLRGYSLNITVAEPKGSRTFQSQPHGCGYSGAASFSVDSRMGVGPEVYAGFISQHSGYQSESEYNFSMPEYRSLVSGTDSF